MSPELLFPEKFDLKDGRPTSSSDCYALGMVIYEVLSGQKPFYGYGDYAVVVRIHQGKRPVRPRRAGGRWFTDSVWNTLERCWERSPCDRPRVEDVLHCLEMLRSWVPPQMEPDPPVAGPSTQNLDSSSEGSTNEGQVSSPSVTRSQSWRTSLPKGDAGHKTPTSTISLMRL